MLSVHTTTQIEHDNNTNSKPYSISGVRFPGLTHPGIIGTAPSMELLNIWNERERQLEENGLHSLKLCEVLHQRPLANLPSTKGCVLGKVNSLYKCERAIFKNRSFSHENTLKQLNAY